MCGITGVFNLNQKPLSLGMVKRMAATIAHRGPDGEGYYIKDNIALAHKRLAILDPSPKGAQPMISKNGHWILVFNGCIYNFLELKQDLQSHGHEFLSGSDTEVLVEGIAQYGIEFVKKLNGMFAFAAWNTVEKSLYLSRDCHGIKPLYYWFKGDTLVFASEIKAIKEHPDFKTEINFSALNEYFTFQNIFRNHTFFKDVYMLPPASYVKIDEYTTSIDYTIWWDYNFAEPDPTMTFEEAVLETERLFRNAVTRQLISDVPVGSYLSGGMDSGSITAVASSKINRLTTFTCGFDMSEITGVEANYDERRDAELMANHFKTEHFEQVINSADLSWAMPRVVYHLENPRVGMSYPNYYISRLASKFVKVCLQGTGGDELFGGYPWRYYRVFNSVNQQEYLDSYYNFWQRLVPDKEEAKFFTPSVNRIIDYAEPRHTFNSVFKSNNRLKYDTPEHYIENSLYFEIKTFLHGLLIVGDKLAMANGLEERFPFLDNELVEFSQKIPVKFKLGNLENMKRIDENVFAKKKKVYHEVDDGKSVLRKAMKDFIPSKIINRKKQGFSAPDENWYRGSNARYIRDLILGKKTIIHNYIERDYIKNTLYEHAEKGINHRLLIWSFMNFEWWCRLFLNGEKIG